METLGDLEIPQFKKPTALETSKELIVSNVWDPY